MDNATEQFFALGEASEHAGAEIGSLGETLNQLSGQSKIFANGLERDLSGAMRNLVVEGTSFRDAFKSLAMSVADRSFQAAMTPALESISTGLVASLGFANGGVFHAGQVQAFAHGGVVNSPTYFPMSSGLGLMGEAGDEAIMPLSRGADGRLGVRSQGGNKFNISMNINAKDSKSFRKSQAQIASELRNVLSRLDD